MKGDREFRLLSRDAFREGVFARDHNKCVVCQNPAKDAHHILERRLFTDGGYYIENGASVCEQHHIEAEETRISCEQLRKLAGIVKFPLPAQLYSDQRYDKWGNPILPNGSRLKGELFHDPSVQKVLSPFLALFTDRVKYPRTYHLPWSPGITRDDRVMTDLLQFEVFGKKEFGVVATIKMDGENTTLYRDYLHARSIEYEAHPSRSWIKALHSRIAHDIPKGWRICGENLFAKHSIKYQHLQDYFLVFSIWDEMNFCLSWEATKIWAELLELKTVPVLYHGNWDEKLIRNLHQDFRNDDPCEGYVVRLAEDFHYRDFYRCVGKYVRKDHVQTDEHWMRSELETNQPAEEKKP